MPATPQPLACPSPSRANGASPPPLTYSAQPPKSRVRVERDAEGVTLTILPVSFRGLLPYHLGIGALACLLFLGLVHPGWPDQTAGVLAEPAVLAAWVGIWVACTAAYVSIGLPLHLLLDRKTTTVRWEHDFLRVGTQRYGWHRQRRWPRGSVGGVRVTWYEWLAVLDLDGRVLCRVDVPEQADVRWACVVVRDLIENGSSDPAAADFAPPVPAR